MKRSIQSFGDARQHPALNFLPQPSRMLHCLEMVGGRVRDKQLRQQINASRSPRNYSVSHIKKTATPAYSAAKQAPSSQGDDCGDCGGCSL